MKETICSCFTIILASTAIICMNPLYLILQTDSYLHLIANFLTFLYILIPSAFVGIVSLVAFVFGFLFEIIALKINDLDSLMAILKSKTKLNFVEEDLGLGTSAVFSIFLFNIVIISLLIFIMKSMKHLPNFLRYTFLASYIMILGFLDLPIYVCFSISLCCILLLLILDLAIPLGEIKLEKLTSPKNHASSIFFGVILFLISFLSKELPNLPDLLVWKLPDSAKFFNHTSFPTDEFIYTLVIFISELIYSKSKIIWYITQSALIIFTYFFQNNLGIFIYIIVLTYVLKKFLTGEKLTLIYFCFANIFSIFIKKYVLVVISIMLFGKNIVSVINHTQDVKARIKDDLVFAGVAETFHNEKSNKVSSEDEELMELGEKSHFVKNRFSKRHLRKKTRDNEYSKYVNTTEDDISNYVDIEHPRGYVTNKRTESMV